MKSQLRLSKGRKLKSPEGLKTRPTTARVREAVMNLVGARVQGCDWLDLCSGSGVLGCEALQKGARRVLAIEQDKKTALICKSNLISIAEGNDNEQVQVICHEVISLLKKGCLPVQKNMALKGKFDLVYFDPPFKSAIYAAVLENLLKGKWLKGDSIVICEHSTSIPLEIPHPWIEKDRRSYGSTSLLLVTPP